MCFEFALGCLQGHSIGAFIALKAAVLCPHRSELCAMVGLMPYLDNTGIETNHKLAAQVMRWGGSGRVGGGCLNHPLRPGGSDHAAAGPSLHPARLLLRPTPRHASSRVEPWQYDSSQRFLFAGCLPSGVQRAILARSVAKFDPPIVRLTESVALSYRFVNNVLSLFRSEAQASLTSCSLQFTTCPPSLLLLSSSTRIL